MRYYKLVLENAITGAAITPSSLKGMPITSLLPNGQPNTAALNIEFDITQSQSHVPNSTTASYIRIWGLGLADLGGAFNLNPQITNDPKTSGAPTTNITIYAGMTKGLPLATAAANQSVSPIVKCAIIEAYGNWEGTTQTVDLKIVPPVFGSPNRPTNFSLNWKAGTPLSSALTATLRTAIPNAITKVNISDRLTLAHDCPGYYGSLNQFASVIHNLSKSIITDPGYSGVSIDYSDGTHCNVTDNITAQMNNITFAFTDLIGQPTWIAPNVISVKTMLRSDVDIYDQITLPRSLVSTSAGSFTGLTGNNPANNLTFGGPYTVQEIHHYGNFRQPDAASWATVFNMNKPQSSGGTAASN